MKINLVSCLIVMLHYIGLCVSYGQSDTTANMFKSNVKDLMKQQVVSSTEGEIVSASKKAESLFDAPLAATVITKEDLKASGVTSILEAMRLVPGLIVRETSNGNFEIHIRGLEYVIPYGPLNQSVNRTTLVMIDGRPVYNHLFGGVFWETLPIDINDVERIEIIRGGAVPLYGANAVSGVINFITRKKSDYKDIDIVGNLQYGNFNSTIANSLLSYKVNDKFSFTFSGNYQHRNRTDKQYFSRTKLQYIDANKLNYGTLNPKFIYPDNDIALEKFGLNAFFNYKANSNVEFEFKIGTQESKGHKVFSENSASNLIFTLSQTHYLDFSAKIHGLKAQYNYNWGQIDERSTQSIIDFGVHEANIEYDIEKIKNLRISPFISLREVSYQEIKDSTRNILFSKAGAAKAGNYGAGVKLDYALSKKWRFIGAVRLEYFNVSDTTYLAYQGITTYKPTDNLLLRFVYGRSNAGTFIYNSFLDISTTRPTTIPGFQGFTSNIQGNKKLRLLTQDIFEIGIRAKVNKVMSLDLEAFSSLSQNIAAIITTPPQFQPPLVIQTSIYTNLPVKIQQMGLTLSCDFEWSKFYFKPFITFQQSKLQNFSPYLITPGVNSEKNIEKTVDTTHLATPKFFGGIVLNYQVSDRINIHLSPYFLGKSTYFYLKSVRNLNAPQYSTDIPAQILLNAKIGYQIDKRLNLFVNVRNLFSNKNYQHFHTDRIQASYLVGFNFEM